MVKNSSRDNIMLLAQFIGALAMSYVIAFIVNPCLLEIGVYQRVGVGGIENALFAFLPLVFSLLHMSTNYLRERPLGLSLPGVCAVLGCAAGGLLYGFIGAFGVMIAVELALRRRRNT